MSCLLLDPDRSGQLDAAVEILRRDEPVALPTETVYGLAGRLFQDAALSRIFSLKARPQFDPLIVHVNGSESLDKLVSEILPLHRCLMERFWPGPLTLLFKKNPRYVSDLCTAGSDLVAIRSPSHPVFREVLARLGEPLAAPSANRFGRISPTTASDVVSELGPYGLEAVVDGGRCHMGVESTILDIVSDNEVRVLRPGSLPVESLRECIGSHVKFLLKGSQPGEATVAPGLLASHYAPRTSVKFIEGQADRLGIYAARDRLGDWALLSPFPREAMPPEAQECFDWHWGSVEVLSESGSDIEAAARLFRVLRRLDEQGFAGIVALKMRDPGLGLAINDRLRRAAGRGGFYAPEELP